MLRARGDKCAPVEIGRAVSSVATLRAANGNTSATTCCGHVPYLHSCGPGPTVVHARRTYRVVRRTHLVCYWLDPPYKVLHDDIPYVCAPAFAAAAMVCDCRACGGN